ncbi:MAG: DUF5916 domain-containing protein [Gemmatimonadota bacterium]
MHRTLLWLLTALLVGTAAQAQEADAAARAAIQQQIAVSGQSGKDATAVRVPNGSVALDGVLDEDVWATVPAVRDFLQKEPVQGAPPSQPMEVRFVYDDEALYVGARMYSADPAGIQAPLGRRDQASNSAEHILISLDTFLDRRTAYTFGVSASGVRYDRFHSRDEENGDSGFDPVWRARTSIDAEGWTAELWIPYTQLRFNEQDAQTWGLNIRRFIPQFEEEVYWVVVPRTERAWASRFGDLTGIEGIQPTRRIEMMPFVVGSTTMDATRDLDNPFDDGRNLSSRVGLDLKMGLGPNLTLDATINPDFGQVEADPAEVNLSAFATRFREQRPFFTEGSELLNLRHPNVFYSRRIGAGPSGRATGDFVDMPEQSRILGAAKVTGRLPSGTSIGILGAVTDESFARVAMLDTPGTTRVQVGPRSGYGVVKVQQEIGTSGSTASFLVGGVHRAMDANDPLALTANRNALVYGGDTLLRLRDGEYEFSFTGLGSFVNGEPEAVLLSQTNSAHYLQRPDRTDDIFDPTRTSMSGFSMMSSFNRVSGQNWLFGVSTKVDTPTFETNDVAQLNGADGIMASANVTYRETRPNDLFRSYSIRVNQGNEWNFAGNRQDGSLGTNVNLTWLNFWNTSFSINRELRTESVTLTRGGPLMAGPAGWRFQANLGNSNASQTRIGGGFGFSRDELGGWSRGGGGNLSIRPSPQWQLSFQPQFQQSRDAQQYVTARSGGRPETFDRRYIFSYIDRTTLSAQLRMSYTVRPDLNIDLYAEPFAASGHYFDYGELTEAASLDRITYGAEAGTVVVLPDGSRDVTIDGSTFRLTNRDFNVRSFNSNAVLRWEWRPGSTMYLVWQQNRSARETLHTPVGVQDAFRSFTVPGTNILLFKTSWWLPVG